MLDLNSQIMPRWPKGVAQTRKNTTPSARGRVYPTGVAGAALTGQAGSTS